ncbi:hypothetical protein LJK87_35700 [Paenibacillus sp. P25]|nr:hypothetical protein LJK87_35700 [Paenibacillus sp. P25]
MGKGRRFKGKAASRTSPGVRRRGKRIAGSSRKRRSVKQNVQVTRIAPPNNEPSVAVNPLNEKIIVSAYNADLTPLGFSRSTDGGRRSRTTSCRVPRASKSHRTLRWIPGSRGAIRQRLFPARRACDQRLRRGRNHLRPAVGE